MSLERHAMDASVEAYRREPAVDADGRATRVRVLVAAGGRVRRRALARHLAVVTAILVVAALTGSAAWTAIGRWRAARDVGATVVANPVVTPVAAALAPKAPGPPSSVVRSPPPKATVDEEAKAYGRAHAEHFVAGDAAGALGLWDAYLVRYPRGTFAPEARFNRALCLLRLGRRDEARAALGPFATGAFGRYRQQAARTLLDWTEVAPVVR